MVSKPLNPDSPFYSVFNGAMPVLDTGPVYIFDWREATKEQLWAIAELVKAICIDDLELQAQSLDDIVREIQQRNLKIKMEHFI
jgi:hypothetical protein